MNTKTQFENINTVERSSRFVAAMAIILFAMHSTIAGGTIAFVSLVGIATALASLSIIGWCPLVALLNKLKSVAPQHGNQYQHA